MGSELIGRGHALAVAEHELDRLAAGRGGLLLISGEAGIGKSTLAAEIGAVATGRGALVAAGACTDSEGTPGRWPWVQVVRRLARVADSEEWAAATAGAGDALDPLLGERTAPPSSGGDASFRLHDALTTLLVTVAARRPIVVVLEDLQHADPASLAVLDFLTRHAWFEPVLVVGTYRDTEIEVPAHPGRPLLLPLLARATHLHLTGLDHDGVRELLARAGREPDHAAVAEVLRRTGGNPFFAEQTALLDGAVSAGVSDVVERRLEVLGATAPDAADVLAAAAVAGHTFDPDVAALLAGNTDGDAALAAAEAAALIVRRDGRCAFVHDLVREHLYARLPARRARDLHAALVGILRRRPATAPATLARHARLAVPSLPVAEAVPLLVAAAEDAGARLAAEEAVRHLCDALALDERLDPPDPDRRADIQLELAAQLDRAGKITAARETALGVFARATDRPVLRARAALQVHRLGNPAEPGFDEITMLDTALAGPVDGSLRARLLAAAGMARTHQGRTGGADLARRAVELARAAGDPDALAWALLARHDGNWGPGTAGERIAVLDELAPLSRARGLRELEGLAAFLRFVALLERGDRAAHDAFAAFEALTERTRLPRHRYLVASRRACLAMLSGDLDRAAHLVDDARDLGARFGEVDRTPAWRDQAWAVHTLRGDHTTALEIARTAVPGHPFTALLEGLSAAAAGDGDRALSRLDDVDQLMAGLPRRYGWMHLVYLCEVAAVTGDPELCERARAAAAPQRDAWAVFSAGGVVWGPMAYWLARVDAASDRRAEAIDGFTAALAGAQRWGARPWIDRAQAALTTLHADDPKRLVERFSRGEGVWTLAYAGRTVHVPDAKGLRDIATLLATPHRDVPAVDLLRGPDSTHARHRVPGADPIIDETARDAYRRRLTDLDTEIDDALDRGDDSRAARLDAERDSLLAELRRAAGLAGRTRRLGDERERARQTVSARIRDSIRRLRATHPELAEHLTGTVRTGTACSYRPTEPVGWQLRP